MSTGEQIAGAVFFLVYLLVLPLAAAPLQRLAESLLGVSVSAVMKNVLYYYVLFAVTLILFHGYLLRTTRRLIEEPALAFQALALGLIALYGLNELAYRVSSLFLAAPTNLNNSTISAQIDSAPHMTALIVIFLAPFVEEVLFRGLVFGNLRGRSRWLAYLVSCLLFALLHVWQFAVKNHDLTYFVLMVQYLVPGLVLAWTYDHSGTLWSSIALHAAANALSVWTML
jgi:hypothetical protein